MRPPVPPAALDAQGVSRGDTAKFDLGQGDGSDAQQRAEAMSDDNTAPRRVITGADLARFHAAKGIDSKNIRCWVCGHGSWYIRSDDDAPFHMLQVPEESSSSKTPNAFKVLTLTCKTCGTFWNIDYEMLTEWLQSNPK